MYPKSNKTLLNDVLVLLISIGIEANIEFGIKDHISNWAISSFHIEKGMVNSSVKKYSYFFQFKELVKDILNVFI